jgi:ribonuclease-3
MSSSPIHVLQTNLGHHFKNANFLLTAITHKSHESRLSNERLEFLGDAILNYVVASMLHARFPGLTEGEMSRTRAALVCHSSLVKVATRIGLAPFIRVGEDTQVALDKTAILSDAMEALFGAIEIDADHATAKAVIEYHMLTLLNSGEADLGKDPKTQLQEVLQARGLPTPKYAIVDRGGTLWGSLVTVTCEVAALALTTRATGGTRKEAEKAAAAKALARVGR